MMKYVWFFACFRLRKLSSGYSGLFFVPYFQNDGFRFQIESIQLSDGYRRRPLQNRFSHQYRPGIKVYVEGCFMHIPEFFGNDFNSYPDPLDEHLCFIQQDFKPPYNPKNPLYTHPLRAVPNIRLSSRLPEYRKAGHLGN